MKILTGKVINGNKLGREIGFPTANIEYLSGDLPDSVFHINIVIDGKLYHGMGTNMISKGVFEAHIFDFSDDIYEKEIEIILLKELRSNRVFGSQKELIAQLKKDERTIRNEKLNILTFGSFDTLHEGHEFYFSEAQKYGTHLITIVATDENIKKIKGFAPKYSTLERVEFVLETGIPHEVLAGSEDKPMQWLEKYKPHCICLGYDQKGRFVDTLPQALLDYGLTGEIIRIPPYKPELYKSSLLKKKQSR